MLLENEAMAQVMTHIRVPLFAWIIHHIRDHEVHEDLEKRVNSGVEIVVTDYPDLMEPVSELVSMTMDKQCIDYPRHGITEIIVEGLLGMFKVGMLDEALAHVGTDELVDEDFVDWLEQAVENEEYLEALENDKPKEGCVSEL